MTDETKKTELATVDEAWQEVGEMLSADAKYAEEQGDYSWLPNFFLGKLDDCARARERIKEQAAIMQRQVQTIEKALWWKYGVPFMAQVKQDRLAQGKKKSVDYHHGRAGWRTVGGKPQLIFDDEEEALANAEILCPEAVSRKLKPSEIKAYIEKTGSSLPGTHLEETEKAERFYPARPDALELEGDETPLLESENDG